MRKMSEELPIELKQMLINFFASKRAGITTISPLLEWITKRQIADPTFDLKNWLRSLGYEEDRYYLRLWNILKRYQEKMAAKQKIEQLIAKKERKTMGSKVLSKTGELAEIKFEVANKFVDEIIPIASQLGYETSVSGILDFCRFLKSFYEENREKVEQFDDAIALIKVLSDIVNPYFIRIMGQRILADTIIKLATLRANGLKIPYEYEKFILEELKNKLYEIIYEYESKLAGVKIGE